MEDGQERLAGAFKLKSCLAADLRRARHLAGQRGDIGDARLILAMLSPRFTPVLLCRLAYWLHLKKLGPLAKLTSLVNFAFFGIEIAVRCPIGKGLFFPHTQGTVIGAAVIGENATIYHGVTLGARDMDLGYCDASRPTLGDDVLVGAGAKILGGVTIGAGARIGANALVMKSVPAGAHVRAPLGEIIAADRP